MLIHPKTGKKLKRKSKQEFANNFTEPENYKYLLKDFPELKIVVAHIGHGWWRQTLDLASMKPNMYVDFSGWQGVYQHDPGYVTSVLRSAIDTLGPWRVLFGSDGALLNVIMPLPEWVKNIKNINSVGNVKFSNEELEIIYKEKVQRYKSAKRGLWDSQEGWIEEPRKYFDWEIDQMLQAWVLRALGALIKKGYLTVIPRISLNKISLEEVKS